jgi:hypothetical protein
MYIHRAVPVLQRSFHHIILLFHRRSPPSIRIPPIQRKLETPSCPHCQGITAELVKHYLLDCPKYNTERHTLQRKLCHNSSSLSFLLSSPVAVKPLLKYDHATGQFKTYFVDSDKPLTNAQEVANLRANIQAFKEFLRHPPL